MEARRQDFEDQEIPETADQFHNQRGSPSKSLGGPTYQPNLHSPVNNPQGQTMSDPNSGQQRQAENYFTPIQTWLPDGGRVLQNESQTPQSKFSNRQVPDPIHKGLRTVTSAPYHHSSIGFHSIFGELWTEKMEEKRVHIRHCLLFDFDLGVCATQAHRHLCQTEGRDAPSLNTCHYWYNRFRSGDRSLEDRPRSRRPSEVDLDALRSLVEADPRATTRSLATTLHCSNTAIDNHLHSIARFSRWEGNHPERQSGTVFHDKEADRFKRRLLETIADTEDLAQDVDALSRALMTTADAIRNVIADDDRFLLTKENKVSLQINLSLCNDHMTDDGCEDESCQSLHICPKYFVKLCTDPDCENGHDLDSLHNKRILSQRKLEKLDLDLLKKLLNPDSVVPDLCEDYNVGFCSQGNKCRNMHICAEFFTKDCKECQLNHNIMDFQCQRLLQQANVKLNRSPKELRIYLKKKCSVKAEDILKRKGEAEKKPIGPGNLRGKSSKQPNRERDSIFPCQNIETFTHEEPETKPISLAHKMKNTCKDIDEFIHELPKKKVMENANNRLAKYEIGDGAGGGVGKVLMVVGATGAGKSTLINGIVNYAFDVAWEDEFRFKLIVDEGHDQPKSQSQSQTKWITAYVLNKQQGFNLPYTLTVIDTPGFGDTEGIKADEALKNQIREFFSHGGNIGVDQLDGICFVVQASLARLTPTQKYIFDSILAVFGKDVVENIFVLITFADSQAPPVLCAIKDAGVPYTKSFKFNNSALFVNRRIEPENEGFDRFFWNMGFNSFKNFFQTFQSTKPVSLTLTKEVLKERQRLEAAIQGIQPQITAALGRLEQLRQEYAALKQHEAEILANKNFEYKVEVSKQKKIPLVPNEYVTNCLVCHYTCHFPCFIPKDEEKDQCNAMDDTGSYCTVCPKGCPPAEHVNADHRLEWYQEEECRTYANLKANYEQASGKKMTAQEIVKELIKDFNEERVHVLDLTTKAHECLQKLQKIALKPDPLGVTEYIDLMIEAEKRDAAPGYLQRITYLEDARRKADLAEKLKDKFDPFETYMKEFEQEGIDISCFDPPNVGTQSSSQGQGFLTTLAKGIKNTLGIGGK
ncbi:unnamed protein product [Darwinula stevensoni]|uniref:C3H1-type domain-containing protein n=1 Tax=Darwinula stevensoni TaxID=69355 RepID=A0A7R9A432_9CRUS|nr:unnamed protein product [Darwinula stevensoni]CAG0882562.1 unnamed protein product [Darwinula stevensoni]